MARSPEAASRDSALAARAPKSPERKRAPKAPEAPEDVILEVNEKSAVERAPDQREVSSESYTETGERMVAEAKANAEQRFGGFFASVRARMEAITTRAKEAFFGGVAADVAKIPGKTARALAEVGKSLPEMGLEVGKQMYNDVAEPVFVDPALALGRGTFNAAERFAGGAVNAAFAAEDALRAGKERLEGVSLQSILDFAEKAYLDAEAGDEQMLEKIDARITQATALLSSASKSTRAAAQNALRNLESMKRNAEIARAEKKASAKAAVDAAKRKAATPIANDRQFAHSDVVSTIDGAGALLAELRNKSLDAQEAYEDAMTELDTKLRESFTFMDRMRVKMEIAKTKMRYEVNKAFDDRILGQAEKENAAAANVRAAMEAQRAVDEDVEAKAWFRKAA